MAWPSVKTTITPSHYACIAITLCSLFPPEVAESITRLTKTCDEAQNLLDHGVLYVHTYMLNTLKNISLSSFSGMRLSEVCPSQKTMDTKRCITSHIWRVGKASNNPHIATWGAWIPDNRTVSRRMIDSIKEEYPWNRMVREESINSYWPSSGSGKSSLLEDFLHIYSVKSKRDEEKDYKKIAKKEKKKRNKMLKHQTPKQKMKFSKNQPRYNNRRIN
jgi:hypothetical protein